MRRGLVVGKFMPLHRGHQLLIETALANVDELTVVVYDSDVPDVDMPVSKRASWVAALYPNIENIVSRPDILRDIPYKDKDNPKYASRYAEDLAFLGPFTHVFSSEDYGKPFAKALGAEHILVDQARTMMPISGTMLRENLYAYRAFVDPLVYRSLIQKVVFVGTESVGKTTLSKRMAEEYGTMATLEYGRTLWLKLQEQHVPPIFHDFLKIAETQYDQENAAALHSNRFLFCDTNAWTTYMWSLLYHGVADQRLINLVESTKHEYIWILCDNDFGWVDDGQRELKKNAGDFQTVQYADLIHRGIDFRTLRGSIEGRVKLLKEILA